jgi:hypothetical protein
MSEVESDEAFDPYAILRALQDARVDFILIGALARVLHGSDEVTTGLDLTPSLRVANLERLEGALERLGGVDATEEHSETNVRALQTPAGEIRCVAVPVGTRGYPDLRRKARRLHLGEGLRPHVAAPGDLVRMLEALGRPRQSAVLEGMRRVVELDRGLDVEVSWPPL